MKYQRDANQIAKEIQGTWQQQRHWHRVALEEFADDLLLHATPGTADGFVVTIDWINQHRTPAGGLTGQQMSIIGAPFPPRKGWIGRAIGMHITEAERLVFESYSTWTGSRKSLQAAVAKAVGTPSTKGFGTTTGAGPVGCTCDVLPWEDCEHSLEREDREAEMAMADILN